MQYLTNKPKDEEQAFAVRASASLPRAYPLVEAMLAIALLPPPYSPGIAPPFHRSRYPARGMDYLKGIGLAGEAFEGQRQTAFVCEPDHMRTNL